MQIHRYAFAGILAASAMALSACEGGDPGSTGSTDAPAIQGENAPAQAIPAPSDGQENKPAEGTNTGG